MIRPLLPEHAEAAAALIRASFAGHLGRVDPPPSALKETAGSLAAALAQGGGAGAFDGEALLGCVLWREDRGGLYMGRLAVAEAARGRGIARALVAEAAAEARRRGLGRLWLSTRLQLAGNRALFAACGFRETALHAHPGYAEPTYVDMEMAV